jgi:glycine oxidase
MHIVIAGNGILAQSIAFELLQHLPESGQITLVGRSDRIGSATLAAAAMLNSYAEIEKGSLETPFDLYRFNLSQQAARIWPDFARSILKMGAGGSFSATDTSSIFDTGTFVVNNAAADNLDDENFEAILKALKKFEEPHSLVECCDIPNYQPEQRYRAIRAVYIEREGWMNPRQVVTALDQVLQASPQVKIINQPVSHFKHSNGRILALECESGDSIDGDKFILATGATVTDILNTSQLDLPIQRVFYGVGVSVEIKSQTHFHTKCIRTPNRGLACGVYTAPHSLDLVTNSGTILIGATNLISPEPLYSPRVSNVESLLRASTKEINKNFYRAELVRINIGWRPTSLDTQPLLGYTSINNLMIASGTKRDGFHLAPIIAQKLAAMILGKEVEPEFAWFAPERKPLHLLSREVAIEKAVRHQISAAYQHGFTPPTSRMPDQIRAMLRDEIERLHDKVGAHNWGIPPEMLDMYRYGHAVP